MSDIEVPDRMRIRGGSINTRYKGNGFIFDHDAMAEMAEQMPDSFFVKDHDRKIESVAGLITDTSVQREQVPASEIFEGNVGGIENTTKISREAELTNDFPAYQEVAKSILLQQDNGLVPNTSIAFISSGIRLENDELVLEGPYRFVHDSLVDQGAQRPEQDVGIFEVEMTADTPSSPQFTLDETGEETVMTLQAPSAELHCMNMGEISDRFEAEHGISPQELLDLAEEHDMKPGKVLDAPDFNRCGGPKTAEKAEESSESSENPLEKAVSKLKDAFSDDENAKRVEYSIKEGQSEVKTAVEFDSEPENTDEVAENESETVESDLKVPQNPQGGSGEGSSGSWDSSQHASLGALADFVGTDAETWADFSEEEKNQAARIFADAADNFTESFNDDLNLPHHFTKGESAPNASLNGARNALARLPQTEDVHSSEDEIESHLNSHLPADEERNAWQAYLRGENTLNEVADIADFSVSDLGLSDEEIHDLVEAGLFETSGDNEMSDEENTNIMDLTDETGNNPDDASVSSTQNVPTFNSSATNSDVEITTEMWKKSTFSDMSEAKKAPYESDIKRQAGESDTIASGTLSNDELKFQPVDNPNEDGATLTENEASSDGSETEAEELEAQENPEPEVTETEEELQEAEVEDLSGETEDPELPSEFQELKEDYQKLKSELEEVLKERRAKRQAELEDMEERLELEFGVDESTIEALKEGDHKERLEALESELRSAQRNRIPDVTARAPSAESHEAEADEQARNEWLEESYLGDA